ncbi:hypothetical protein JYU34_011510 [Plutella xylostella]|uniref:Carboxypeptidase inhibitor n=1 Tax=Plutella xylostella TaxID=51655 RepID=A0ABQ7QIF4_PLUXY|nr:hypothetical protein JYU34_011510 [Plutella xylostella]
MGAISANLKISSVVSFYLLTLLCLDFVSGKIPNTRDRQKDEDFRKLDAIRQEPPCVTAGGFCTALADCPAGAALSTPGLCPRQQRDGIECCQQLSLKETRCRRHGGRCVPLDEACRPQLGYLGATDCPEDTRCCILTR